MHNLPDQHGCPIPPSCKLRDKTAFSDLFSLSFDEIRLHWPNLDLISQSIENNNIIEINNNISVVPNVIYSSSSPNSINQLNNISIVPQVVKLQNYENNNIDEF